MTTQEIAERLYGLCKIGQLETAQNELYSESATSTEMDMDGNWNTISGLESIKEKGRNFRSMIEQHHGGHTNDPKIFGNHIFMEMGIDVTMKGQERMYISEMCHYEVSEGKIIMEQFYY
jgi:hypothetical protein